MYIVDPDLNSEQISAITSRYRQIVETTGGVVEKIDVWERRRLAYEIKGHTEGIYVVMFFRGEATVEAELRRVFQISEDQFRFIIVKPDESEAGGGPLPPTESETRQRPAPAAAAPVAVAEPFEASDSPAAEATPPAAEPAPPNEEQDPEGIDAEAPAPIPLATA